MPAQPAEKASLQFAFRKATARDLPAITKIYEAAFQKFLGGLHIPSMLRSALQDDVNQELTVAEDKNGNIAGFVHMNTISAQKQGEINIDAVAVDEKYRGQGLGRRLMVKAEEIAKEFNFRTMTLQVHEDNASAIGLYKSMGYQTKDKYPRYYSDGKGAYMMKKPLTPDFEQPRIQFAAQPGYRA